jgi:hypothetical protein
MRLSHRTRLLVLGCLFGLVVSCADREDQSPAGTGGSSREQPDTTYVAHPSDGQGRAVVTPGDPVRVSQWGSWRILFFPGEAGIRTGGGIVFQVSPFWGWSMPQATDPEASGYTTVTASRAGVVFDVMEGDPHYLLCVLEEGTLGAGDTVTIIYGDTIHGKSPNALARADRYAEREEEFTIKVDGDGDSFFVGIENPPSIDIVGREARKIVAYAPSTVVLGEAFTIRVSALDGLGNRDPDYEGAVEFDAGRGEFALPVTRRFTRQDSGSVAVRVVVRKTGIHRIRLRTTDGSMEAVTNPIRSTGEPPGLRLYWGDLQVHSGLSDGTGMPEEIYTYARDVSRLDVCALTDHDAHGIRPLDESPDLWERIGDAAEAFYEPGRFVTFLGYEWTNWTYGHRHVLFPGTEGAICSFRDPDCDTPEELYEFVRPFGGILIPHHPAGGPVAVDWDYHDSTLVHGNSDYYGCPGQIYRARSGHFVQDALDRGYRLGIIGSGDTHDGHPGRRSADYPSMGLAGIWAPELTRGSIWAALTTKRVYGTSGARIILQFAVDGRPMGSVCSIPGQKDGTIFFHAVGTDRIHRVEILEDDRVIFEQVIGETEVSIERTHRLRPGSFYRARLIQEDGEMAWSSPVWCEQKR